MDGTNDRSSPPHVQRADDLEYDLAHEGEEAARVARQSGQQQERESVQVQMTSADHDCDYGYDLAHDVPRR